MLSAVRGETIEEAPETVMAQSLDHDEHGRFMGQGVEQADIQYGYCTEFIVKLSVENPFDQDNLKNILMNMGDSLVLGTR